MTEILKRKFSFVFIFIGFLGNSMHFFSDKKNKQKVIKLNEKKVFYDENGTRWEKIKKTLLVASMVLLTVNFWYWPNFFNIAGNVKEEDPGYPKELVYSDKFKNLPVIGHGHMVRVMKVKNGELIDPFTGKSARKIDHEESKHIADKTYTLERYGTVLGKHLAITFDDGPDPRYTPKILDILAKEKVQATFFVTGKNATKHPEIIKRMAREGHLVANHTLSHIDFDRNNSYRNYLEVKTTDQIIQALTEHKPTYFRLPYAGSDDASLKDNVLGILTAQQNGYETVSFTFDSDDWKASQNKTLAKSVPLNQAGNVLLLHDAGGDRTGTISYLEDTIKNAKKQGFSFYTVSQLTPNPSAHFYKIQPSLESQFTTIWTQGLYVWPNKVLYTLFFISLVSVFFSTIFNGTLTLLNRKRLREQEYGEFNPTVSVVIAAYNEEIVIEKTVKTLLTSNYKYFEVIVVDDGSTDNTLGLLIHLARQDDRIRVVAQSNGGKSKALNTGISRSQGDILVALDADTLFLPDTLQHLVKHFEKDEIGAVAGFVKVGNLKNIITMWQALEYISGITFERFAHSYLGRMMIVPGACAAWRKDVVLKAGGFSDSTLAEDCDLTLLIQKLGYKTVTDIDAIALTEAPTNIPALMKQRFRWTFGNLQAFWKHRDMIFRRKYGILGMYALPMAVFSALLPIFFLPFVYFMMFKSLLEGNVSLVLTYFIVITFIHFGIAIFSTWLANESYKYLVIVPIYRLIYEPLRIYVLYAAVLTILKGRAVGWNKLKRSGGVQFRTQKAKP